MNDAPSTLKPVWVVLCFTAVHAGLVFFRLDHHGLWLDEVMSINAAMASWPEMWRFFTALPEQHPLYYLILRPWLFAFGDSPAALRSLSAVFSVATVPALYLFVRRLVGTAPALMATGLFALAPFSVFYGQEGRMYSLLLFLVCVSSALWLRVLSSQGPDWPKMAYVAVAVAGVYTHFFFAFVVLAHGILGMFWPGRDTWSGRVRALTLPTLVGLLYLPWIIVILLNFPEGQGWKGPAHAIFAVPYTLLRFAVGYTILMPNHGWQEQVIDLVRSEAVTLTLAFIGFAYLSFVGSWALRRDSTAFETRAILTLGLVPVALPLMLSPFMILAGERYFLVVYPLFWTVTSLGVAHGTHVPSKAFRSITWGALLSILFLWLISHTRYFFSDDFAKEPFHSVLEHISAFDDPDLPIAYFPSYIGPTVNYHLDHIGARNLASYGVSCEAVLQQRQWIIISFREDPTDIVACLSLSGHTTEVDFFTEGVGIGLLRVESPTTP